MLNRVLEFITLSVPEEFFIALFVWAILGKTETVKFINVIYASLITAISFLAVYAMFTDLTQKAVIQAIVLAIITYFMYKATYIEAIIGSLLVHLVIIIIQSPSVTLGLAITRTSIEVFRKSIPMKFMLGVIPECIVLALCAYIFYRQKIKIFNFKNNKVDKQSASKIGYLILQLTFALVIVIINYKLFFKNATLFKNEIDIFMLIIDFVAIIVFTILTINKAFKMGERIQIEEQLKRQLDGREMIQNLDYLCKLIDANEYEEAKNILYSIKREVDIEMISSENNRVSPIK